MSTSDPSLPFTAGYLAFLHTSIRSLADETTHIWGTTSLQTCVHAKLDIAANMDIINLRWMEKHFSLKKLAAAKDHLVGEIESNCYRRSQKQCTSNFSFPSELTFPLGVQLCTIKLLKKAASPPAFPSGLVGSPSDLHWCVWEHENVNRAYFLACKKQSWIFRHKYIKMRKIQTQCTEQSISWLQQRSIAINEGFFGFSYSEFQHQILSLSYNMKCNYLLKSQLTCLTWNNWENKAENRPQIWRAVTLLLWVILTWTLTYWPSA